MKTTAFLIRVMICFALSLIPLTELEQRIYSTRVELRGQREIAKNLAIIDIEAEDFKALKREYFLARGNANPDRFEGLRDLFYWDPVIFREVLKSLLSQDPQAVLVTWYIPNEVVESAIDPELEKLARNPKVIWSSQFDPEGKFLRPARRLVNDNYGFNNLLADSDGVIRSSQLKKLGQPSLTRAIAPEAREPLARRSGPYLINYMGPPGSVPLCRLADLMSGKATAPCSDLKGKILLLAREGDRPPRDANGESFHENYFRTPLGEMSRAEILANEIHTVVNRHPIYKATWVQLSLIILALVLGAGFYINYYPVVVSAIAIMGSAITILFVVFQLVFHLFDIYIPSANAAFALLITYLVFTGYRLAYQENRQWRSLKQAQYQRELDQMKSNFLSLVSHDLKTPISKIQAVVERLRRESHLPPEERTDWKELFESIDASNNELKHYVTSVLNLSRIESQKVILNRKSNDINRIIEDTLKRLRPLATQKQIRFETELEPLFSVECDEDLMKQVLANLVDNAIKYSPPGSRVIVRSREEDGSVRVEVEDFGAGIPKDQLPLMFRKFQRFSRPLGEQVKGTGLGLYLSKYFIELHGGKIRVQSVEGQGSVFSFSLPLQSS